MGMSGRSMNGDVGKFNEWGCTEGQSMGMYGRSMNGDVGKVNEWGCRVIQQMGHTVKRNGCSCLISGLQPLLCVFQHVVQLDARV